MRYILFFILLIGLGNLNAQKKILVFLNETEQQAVQIRTGGLVLLEYSGYLKQKELSMNYMISVNDSSVILGKSKVFGGVAEKREIRIEDITGVRKISVGSQLLKFTLTSVATIGSYYALSDMNNINTTERLLYSTGIGLTTNFAIKLAFPTKKVKYKLNKNWKVFTL
ncbi:hypothetical protein [Plebeiibacterium sediminum]|uniref:Uncharacterized protein n=1 Tax=Plebeiibacterium sediminum TaxID=2992112 RepID=A0AAE3SF28_9BACT|nr:hypothetical protein [Plebeiobacterium sediminum]MCW3786826.1 hypothetical protein [Plebeiobacterium sediminum]